MTFPSPYPGQFYPANNYPGNGGITSGAMLTVTAMPQTTPPSFLIEADGLSGTTVVIVRNDPDGSATVVRSADPYTLISGTATVSDYEAPFNVPVTYTATYTGGRVQSSTAFLAVTQSWLSHAAFPSFSQVVNFLDAPIIRTRPTSNSLHYVMGRDTPIPIGDGQRKSATFGMTLWTDSPADEMGMDNLIDDDSPLLLRAVSPFSTRTIYEWISLADTSADPSTGAFEDTWREWPMQCTVVARPVGSLQTPRTMATLAGQFANMAGYRDGPFTSMRGITTGIEGT